MTNEEVFIRAYDEVRLRGLSPKTVESYLGRLKLFLKYFNDRPIEEMGEIEIREYLLYLLDSGHSAGSVNVCNKCSAFYFRRCNGAKPKLSTHSSVARLPRRKPLEGYDALSRRIYSPVFDAHPIAVASPAAVSCYGIQTRATQFLLCRSIFAPMLG